MIEATGSNPFATRYFAPGAISYLFPAPHSTQSLVDRIRQSPSQRTAIVGPHGSGKSTLMTELFLHPSVVNFFPSPRFVRLGSDHSPRQRWTVCVRSVPHRSLAMIDGYEQLGMGMQWTLRALARARGTHLLVSAHSRPKYFEEIWRTYVDCDIEQYVVSHMLAENPHVEVKHVFRSEAWAKSRARHGQNLRESLFDMYDWYRDQVDVQKRQR